LLKDSVTAGTEGRKVKAIGPLEIARMSLTNDIKDRQTAQCASRSTDNAVVAANSSLRRTETTRGKDKHTTAGDLWPAHSRRDAYEWLVTDMSGWLQV